MNSEVKESTRIIKVINQHLQESDCHHNIKSIMREAMELESKRVRAYQTQTADDDADTEPVTNQLRHVQHS